VTTAIAPEAALNPVRAEQVAEAKGTRESAPVSLRRLMPQSGLIRRIQPTRSPARYEDRVDDNHHHLICRTCGRTVDVDCSVDSRPCLGASDDHGFIVDEAEVIYWGICPTCKQTGP